MHVCQKYRIPRQRVPASPPHALSNSRETYLANILTASVFCANDLQRFRKFTMESQKQWIALLESYQDIKYRDFTPGYEEVPDILEKLRAVISDRYASSQPSKKPANQPQKDVDSKSVPTVTSSHRRPYASVNSKTMLPPDGMMLHTQAMPGFQYPENLRHLPRLTLQPFREQITIRGLRVSLSSLFHSLVLPPTTLSRDTKNIWRDMVWLILWSRLFQARAGSVKEG